MNNISTRNARPYPVKATPQNIRMPKPGFNRQPMHTPTGTPGLDYRFPVKSMHASELYNAVGAGDMAKAEELLKNGMNPNETDSSGNSLLQIALNNKNHAMLGLLVHYKANPDIRNTHGDSPLHNAVRMHDITATQILAPAAINIDTPNRHGLNALHFALQDDQIEIAKILLANKANPETRDLSNNTPLNQVILKQNLPLAVTLLDAHANPNIPNGKQERPLNRVIEQNMDNWVPLLLKYGAAPDAPDVLGRTPIFQAVKSGKAEVTEALLTAGANPNQLVNAAAETLLNFAISKGYISLVELLIKHGADIHQPNRAGENAILMAAKTGNVQMMDILLRAGADIKSVNPQNGKTALHLAARSGVLEAVNYLIDKGANINARDKEGNNAIFEAIPQIRYWWHRPRPTPAQSDIIHSLITHGADTSIYETNSFLLAQIGDALHVRHADFANNFLTTRLNHEWDRSDERRINTLLEQFASQPKIGENEIDKLLLHLLHPDINYKDDIEATRHSAHLRSWNGQVPVNKEKVDAEGWWMDVYPPLKTKSLIMSLNKLKQNPKDTVREFGETKAVLMKKIKHEIAAQMSTYYTQRHHDMLNMITSPQLKENLINQEISHYCKEIAKTPVGTEWGMASGFPGHAIYIGFRKTDENHVARIVYNLGAGLQPHPATKDGLVYPHIVGGIKINHFIDETPEARNYLRGVIGAKLGETQQPTVPIYNNVAQLGGKLIETNIPGIPQKRQLVGNCVLKNNNAAAQNRINNDRFFDWLKAEETRFADEMSGIDKKIIEAKEREKDILSFNYIINMHNKNKDIDATIDNLIRFLEKRSKPTVDISHLRDVERIAVYLNDMQPKFRDELMAQRGALKMIFDVADNRYCDTLKQAISGYQFNRTMMSMYQQSHNRMYGMY